MKNGLERRWTLFPVSENVKEVPYDIAEILDDLRVRCIITAYDIVNMYGGQNIEVWYTNRYIKPTEQCKFRIIVSARRLEERRNVEHEIMKCISRLGLSRTTS